MDLGTAVFYIQLMLLAIVIPLCVICFHAGSIVRELKLWRIYNEYKGLDEFKRRYG